MNIKEQIQEVIKSATKNVLTNEINVMSGKINKNSILTIIEIIIANQNPSNILDLMSRFKNTDIVALRNYLIIINLTFMSNELDLLIKDITAVIHLEGRSSIVRYYELICCFRPTNYLLIKGSAISTSDLLLMIRETLV